MAKRHRLSFPQIVSALKEAGLDNVNGGAAEIFAEATRAENLPEQGLGSELAGAFTRSCTAKASPATRRCSTGTSNRWRTGSIT